MSLDPWPEAPELPTPIIMDQHWTRAVFLHWRIPEPVASSFMPPGVVPDSFDGSAWVGLIGFRMQGAGLGRGPGVPYFGSFAEINVRLYSREPDGTRGVVFLSLDASRLAVVLAARAAGIPYVWSLTSFTGADALHPAGPTGPAGAAGGGAAVGAGGAGDRLLGAAVPGRRPERFRRHPRVRRRSDRPVVGSPDGPVRSAFPVQGQDPLRSQHAYCVAVVPGATDPP